MATDLLRWRKEANKISPSLWVKVADAAGTTPAYLDQLAYGFSQSSPKLAAKIADATRNIKLIPPVSKESIVFGKIDNAGNLSAG